MTILSNKKQSQQQQSQSQQQTSPNNIDANLTQQQQSTTLPVTTTTTTTPNPSIPSPNQSNNKQRIILLVNDNKNDENINNQSSPASSSVINSNSGIKSPHLLSSPCSSTPCSSSSSPSSPLSSNTTSPEFKTNLTTTALITERSENLNEILFVEPTNQVTINEQHSSINDIIKQQTENKQTLQAAECSHLRKHRNKNNKRKIRTNHNTPMPLPPPQQRQRKSQVTKTTTEITTKSIKQDEVNSVNDLQAYSAAAIGSLTSLNNSGDEHRLLNDSDEDDDDSDFDNSDFDLNKFNQNYTSSDREDFNDENNYNHLHHQQQQQQLHFNQSLDFINHHHRNLHHHHPHHHIHQQNRLVLEQENEPVLNAFHRNNNNKPVKSKKKNKKNNSNNNLFNNNKLKRNSIKENLKKENDYLNNNSEDEYENRPIVIRNLSGLGNYNNNQIINGMNTEKNAASTQNLFNAESIEELEAKFCQLLKEKKGFIIRPMKEDGACLFRAVADQIYGDEEMHSTIRSHCMDYIAKNADYFKQYMTEDVERYITRKRQDNCHGNHIEIIAIAEIYNRPIEVYEYSVEPKNTFQGVFQTDNEPIRLSYHGRNHYNSVVDPFKATIGVGLGLPQMTPGLAEKNLMNEALKKSEEFHLEQTMLDDKLKATDWEATNEEIMELVARESYLQWLKDNEKRSMDRNSLNLYCDQMPSANAQCSTWDPHHNRFNPNRRTSTSTPPRSPSQSKLSQLKSSPVHQQQQTKLNERKNKQNDLFYSSLNSNDEKNNRSANNKNSTKSTSSASSTTAITTSIPTTSNKTDNLEANNLIMYDENMHYYETKSIINELTPDLFGLNSNDWIGLDNANNNDSDILARVLAASQQEYLESLKAKRQSSKNN